MRARTTARPDSRAHLSFWLASCALALLSACGGGGGGSSGGGSASLVLSTNTIDVEAGIDEAAPYGTFTASVTSPTSGNFYITGSVTYNGIQTTNSTSEGTADSVVITFKNPASLGLGTYTDTISVVGCYDQACTQQVSNSPQTITVHYVVDPPGPKLAAISPAQAQFDAPGFTLTVTGSNFSPDAVVQWQGSNRPTTFVSATQLTAQIPQSDLGYLGNFPVTVMQNGQISQQVYFVVNPPPFLLTGISPARVAAGGDPFTLTVFGSDFGAGAVVTWNGTNLPTTFSGSAELHASVTADLIASIGTATITVTEPGFTTGAQTLEIDAASIDAVSFQINPAHTGVVNFSNVSLPASSSWSVDVGGTPSYALIAGGRVFVTVAVGGGSQVLALDAGTGAVLWGPVARAGVANAAYADGRLLVTSGATITTQTIEALDPATGNVLWSTIPPGYMFTAPPVAAGGLVYAKNGGELTEFEVSTGTQTWQLGVGGTTGTVAVTVDGVYASTSCATLQQEPTSGEILWQMGLGCSSDGGITPVVATGVMYAPFQGQFSGNQYDAHTGSLLGSFTGSYSPALTAASAYTVSSFVLNATTRSNNQPMWSFTGDGALNTSPIVVNNYVFVGSSGGNLYALDAQTGAQLWTQNLGAPIQTANQANGTMYSGLAAGDGLLLVPAGTKVTAYVLSSSP